MRENMRDGRGRDSRDSRDSKESRDRESDGRPMKRGSRSKYRPEYPAEFIFDYKDPQTLTKFIMEGGKIAPARISKLSLAQQRRLATAIKRARSLGLLPLGSEAYDLHGRPEGVSPKPFQI
jgi:small subunit ribosomal protein S18